MASRYTRAMHNQIPSCQVFAFVFVAKFLSKISGIAEGIVYRGSIFREKSGGGLSDP